MLIERHTPGPAVADLQAPFDEFPEILAQRQVLWL